MIKGVINVSGKAGSGKDTFADMLKTELEQKGYKVCRVNYADYLKYILTKFFNWDGQKDEKGRKMLQTIGTDVIRKRNPDFWVEIVAYTIQYLSDYFDFVICGDCRFPNENDYWVEQWSSISPFDSAVKQVFSINITRLNFETKLTTEQLQHSSENAMKDYVFDYEVLNDTLEGLKETAQAITEDILNHYVYIKPAEQL